MFSFLLFQFFFTKVLFIYEDYHDWSQRLLSAIIQKPMENSFWVFVKGIMLTFDQPTKNVSSLQCPIYTQDNEHLMKHMYVIRNQIKKQEHFRNLEKQET